MISENKNKKYSSEYIRNKLLDICYDNSYLEKYLELINQNINTQNTIASQKHHIIPKCYFKYFNIEIDDSERNKVNLIYGDHVLAHYYLALCAKDFFKLKLLTPVILMIGFLNSNISDSLDESLNELRDNITNLYVEFVTKLSLSKKGKPYSYPQKYVDYVHSLNALTFQEILEILSKEELIDYWLTQNHTHAETCSHFNISPSKLDKLLKYYEIPNKKEHNKIKNCTIKYSKEFIINLYINKNYTASQCSKIMNIKEDDFYILCRKFNIRKINSGKHPEKFEEIVARISYNDFYNYYITENHNIADTCKQFKLSGDTLYKLCKLYNIKKEELKKVTLNYEDVYKYYIIQNHTVIESLKHFKIGAKKFFAFCKANNIKKL